MNSTFKPKRIQTTVAVRRRVEKVATSPPVDVPCPRCQHNNDIITSILKHLDIERHATGELVMWPDADMRYHAITCAISGLINREREITEIESVLLDVGVRPEGQIVDGVKRLVDKYWSEVTKNSESSRRISEQPCMTK